MRRLLILTVILTALFAGLSFSQGPLTNALNLMVRTDSNGALYVYGVAAGAQGPLRNLGNTMLRTYTGGLAVAIAAGSTIDNPGIATTSTDGLVLSNSTAATSGVPVQQSPRLRFRSNVWNTTAVAANNTNDFWAESVPVSGTTPSGLLKVGSSLNGAAATYPLTVSSDGNVTSLFTFITGASGYIGWTNRNHIYSSADGRVDIRDYSDGFGIQINSGTAAPTVGTCGTGTITDEAGTAGAARNSVGKVTSTGATACTVTFGAPAWSNPPTCVLTMRNIPLTLIYISAVSTTAFTVSGLTANDVFSYKCEGRL